MKPQYVDNIAKVVKGTVAEIVSKKADRGNMEEMFGILELDHVRDRQVRHVAPRRAWIVSFLFFFRSWHPL
jgi:translation initiation factor RLI1